MTDKTIDRQYSGLEIAVIGMAGRFPSAESVDDFWDNLVAGVEGISHFDDAELLATGVSQELLSDSRYVRSKGAFPGIEYFDAAFFGYTPADATILDPQVRALHEEVYHALEDAGYSAERRSEAIGLFLGATNNLAWETHTLRRHIEQTGVVFTGIQLNDKDFAATRIAYSLGLTGPAFTLHTACSTSLVAIDMACRNIWTGSCQIALAGGSGLTLPHKRGYLYQENLVYSPDGHCRPFDSSAGGTVEGNGVGVVVLKRLETALRDGDHIYATIKGSATNNDGNRKVGYTAPSIEGQTEVIRKAYRMAGVSPQDISYVETHGTGTALGDPIEVEALTQAFGGGEPESCGLGSVKASIGHLDTAAGVASFIKACKVVEQATAPKTLNFTEINPNVRLGPFHVVAETQPMKRKQDGTDKLKPLRAAVSAFGIGGTNAHLVIEEPPAAQQRDGMAGREFNTFCVAAASEEAVRLTKQRFVSHLRDHPEIDGADLAWTMQNRQRDLPYRYAVGFRDAADLAERLEESLDLEEPPTHEPRSTRRDVYFLFSGLGAQHLSMGRGLYNTEAVFRSHMDEGFEICASLGITEPREVFFADDDEAARKLAHIETTKVMLLLVENAMARTLIAWGLTPKGMIGHSTGELVAACVSGVFSLEDAVRLLHKRGTLLHDTPPGRMSSVKAGEDEIRPYLREGLSFAALNSPEDTTVTGTVEAVEAFERMCTEVGIDYRSVGAVNAYHSDAMNCVHDRFRELLDTLTFHRPTIPYLSNVTGTWITPEQAADPDYYCAHLSGTVRFMEGVQTILGRGDALFVEVGPGKSLASFVRGVARGTSTTAVNMLRHRMEEISDGEHLATAVKKLWESGVALDWKAFHEGRAPRKEHLPLYPFERTEFPVDVSEFHRLLGEQRLLDDSAARPTSREPVVQRVQAPPAMLGLNWARSLVPDVPVRPAPRVLIALSGDVPALREVLDGVREWTVMYVSLGQEYRFDGPTGGVVRPDAPEDMKRLVADLEKHALVGDTFVVHHRGDSSVLCRNLCGALGGMRDQEQKDVVVLRTGGQATGIDADLWSTIGLNLEFPGLRIQEIYCRSDLSTAEGRTQWRSHLVTEIQAATEDVAVSYEGSSRLVPLMTQLHGRRGSDPAMDTSRTVVVCRSQDVDDVCASMVGTTSGRRVDVLPYEVGPFRNGGSSDMRGRSVTVLPTTVGPNRHAVIDNVAGRVQDLAGIDQLVLWDVWTPTQEEESLAEELEARRCLFTRLREQAAHRSVPCHVVSRPRLDVHAWGADHSAHLSGGGTLGDQNVRLYSFGDPTPDGRCLFDVLDEMSASGINTAFYGADLLQLQADSKRIANDDATTGGPDDRASIAQAIAGELKRLLGHEDIGPRQDMFDLGLDSVKLVQFTRGLERQGFKVLSGDVHNNPTVAGLARFIHSGAKRIDEESDSLESAAQALSGVLGLTCTLHEFAVEDQENRVVLFVEDLDDEMRARLPQQINNLHLRTEFLPHYILPATAEDRFLANPCFESLGLSGDVDLRDAGMEKLFARIDSLQDTVQRAVASQQVRCTYPISGTQKVYFKRGAKPQLYLVHMRELVDIEKLQRAMRDVVGRHGLLRSFLVSSLGRRRWREYEPPATFELPVIDLSALTEEEQAEVSSRLVRREWSVDLKVDQLMYQGVILKYNERKYDLLFQFDHSIIDAASGQVFRGDLLKRYQELCAGSTRAMPRALSYRDLCDQMQKGPVAISANEIIDRFDIDAWARYGQQIRTNTAPFEDRPLTQARYSVDLTAVGRGEDSEGEGIESFALVVHLYARLVSRLVGVDKVALDLVFQSRVYEDVDYSNVLGMVADILPVIVSGERGARNDLEALIREKLRLMNSHNVNFSSLVTGVRSALTYGKVYSRTKEARGKSFRPSCMLNYGGSMEDEYDEIWDMTLELLSQEQDALDYADCYCVSKVTGDRLDIVILTKWVDEAAQITDLLDEEIAHLAADSTVLVP